MYSTMITAIASFHMRSYFFIAITSSGHAPQPHEEKSKLRLHDVSASPKWSFCACAQSEVGSRSRQHHDAKHHFTWRRHSYRDEVTLNSYLPPSLKLFQFILFQPGIRPTFLFYHSFWQNARIFCKGWGFCAYRLSYFYGMETITIPWVNSERSIYARQARSLQSTIERMQTSSYALSIKLDFHWISHEESTYPTAPQSDDFVTTS